MSLEKTIHVGVTRDLYDRMKARQKQLREQEGVEVTDAALARSALEQAFPAVAPPAGKRRSGR